MINHNDTICALATSSGQGAISVIRLSGKNAIPICNTFFSKDLTTQKSHTLHFGTIRDRNIVLDEVVVSIFRNPYSYTGEDVIEVSCHGSSYIQKHILQLFVSNGARLAKAGEFTLRAFSNGKMDLSQAEAVADLIASENQASHQVAMQQMRGGYSKQLKLLREELIHFASLIELELDFSEEDVEFADRKKFMSLLSHITKVIKSLIDSFVVGNVMKNGVPVAIVGQPNVGKSTLLNALLNEDRAIVSEIAGTTRDTIEDTVIIDGLQFRFIDTAGLRVTQDSIESIGIQKALEKAKKSQITVFVIDASQNIAPQIKQLEELKSNGVEDPMVVINKIDLNPNASTLIENAIEISAKNNIGLDHFCQTLLQLSQYRNTEKNNSIVSNTRHLEALNKALEMIFKTTESLQENVSTDFLAMDIKQALYHIGEITGEVSTDDLLDNIFSKFCIGK